MHSRLNKIVLVFFLLIDRYFDNLGALIERALRTQGEAMEQAAQAIAKCLREGHMLYTLGTGHGHLLADLRVAGYAPAG